MRDNRHTSTDFEHKVHFEKFKYVGSQHAFLEKWQ